MSRSALMIILLMLNMPLASAEAIPRELHGYWVPAATPCSSSLGIRVSNDKIEFRNKASSENYKIDLCYSCAGGVRYSGNMIYAAPIGSMDFVIEFNAGERLGVAIVTTSSPALESKFPINELELKRCGS